MRGWDQGEKGKGRCVFDVRPRRETRGKKMWRIGQETGGRKRVRLRSYGGVKPRSIAPQ